jgi:hypothetical protein
MWFVEELFFRIVLFVIFAAVILFLLRMFGIGVDWNLFGINLDRVRCPKCRKLMPYIRQAANEREAMWGGWTCATCGTEMDKWGKELSSTE